MNYPMRLIHRYGLALATLLLAGCVESYMPDVADVPTNYLVVDGFINGNGITRIKLTRSVGLSSSTVPVEKGARITIVDDTGVRYPLAEKTPGFYQSDSLQLNPARQYQLRFTTSANVAYDSDLVPLKVSPPIDKVSWQLNGDQVQLLLSTHDATGQSRYYRWGFTETWEFNSAFRSKLEYDRKKEIIIERINPAYTCWRTEKSSAIRQGSTAQLSQDALTDYALATPDSHDERFKVRYSALITQYTQTAAEFNYNELLRKNTEAVGGVNDPLPVQLTGNVHRLDNATEPVLGFVSAHTVQQKRMFIDRQDLPANWTFVTSYDRCNEGEEDLTKYNPPLVVPQTFIFQSTGNTPIDYIFSNGTPIGYTGSTTTCVDCRLRGSNVKPSFW